MKRAASFSHDRFVGIIKYLFLLLFLISLNTYGQENCTHARRTKIRDLWNKELMKISGELVRQRVMKHTLVEMGYLPDPGTMLYYGDGLIEEAWNWFDSIIFQGGEYNYYNFAMKGKIETMMDRFPEAVISLRKACVFESNMSIAEYRLATIYFHGRGMVDSARFYAEKALQKDPDDKFNRLLMCRILCLERDYEWAKPVLSELILDPETRIDALVERAGIFMAELKYEEACQDIQTAYSKQFLKYCSVDIAELVEEICVEKNESNDISANHSDDETGRITILVLPPYDQMANAGRSPMLAECLEKELMKFTGIDVIPFPLKELMGVPYQQVFDKKYCKPILEIVDADVIVMSRLDYFGSTGNMEEDSWNYQVRIYFVEQNKQTDSLLKGKKVEYQKLCEQIGTTIQVLVHEIRDEIIY